MFAKPTASTREPAVAGQFYPADPAQLTRMLQQMLAEARDINPGHIKALIAPHAGYIYSGPVAAHAYHCLQPQADQISRVILLGPSHRVGFHGIATSSAGSYQMPLGEVALDRDSIDAIKGLPQVIELDQAQAFEHSLEVQLPFLQSVLTQFSLVPLVVGDCAAEDVAEVMELLWGGAETLFAISSDLSHYHAYEVAQQQDRKTSDAILRLAPQDIHYDDACGRNPVNGLLLAARAHGLQPELLDLRNSGDTAGTRDRVVGYGAYIFRD